MKEIYNEIPKLYFNIRHNVVINVHMKDSAKSLKNNKWFWKPIDYRNCSKMENHDKSDIKRKIEGCKN